jgi:hypothetical protein
MISASGVEQFEELLDEKITESKFLISGISYSVFGIDEGQPILNVVGYIEDFETKLKELLEWVQ